MGRPRKALGTWGAISARKTGDGRWVARGVYRDLSGVDHDWTASGQTKKRAEAALLSRASENRGAGSVEANMTVTALWTLVKADFDKDADTPVGRRSSSIAEYDRVFRRDIEPVLGDLRIHEVGTPAVDDLLDEIRLRAPAIAGQARVVLRHIFGMPVRLRVLDFNPVDYVKDANKGRGRKAAARRPRALTPEQVQRVLLLCQDRKRNPGHAGQRAIPLYEIFTLLFCGLRIGEVLALRWEDITWSDGDRPAVLHVCGKAVNRDGRSGPIVRMENRKEGDEYWLHIPAQAETVLKAYRDDWMNDGPVFTTVTGTLLAANNVRRAWRELRADSDLPENVIPHDGRHTVGTHVSAAMSTDAGAAVLGHTSPDTTRAHYQDRRAMVPDATTIIGGLLGDAEEL